MTVNRTWPMSAVADVHITLAASSRTRSARRRRRPAATACHSSRAAGLLRRRPSAASSWLYRRRRRQRLVVPSSLNDTAETELDCHRERTHTHPTVHKVPVDWGKTGI